MEFLASARFLLEMTGFYHRGLEAGIRDGTGWFSVTHPRRVSSRPSDLAIGRGFLNSLAMSLAFLKNTRAAVDRTNAHRFFPSHQEVESTPLLLEVGLAAWQVVACRM